MLGLIPARGGPSLPGCVRYEGVSTQIGRIFRSGSFITPRSLQLCFSQPAQKTFLGGVLLTEFPRCGLECSHPHCLGLVEFRILKCGQTKQTVQHRRGQPMLLDIQKVCANDLNCGVETVLVLGGLFSFVTAAAS